MLDEIMEKVNGTEWGNMPEAPDEDRAYSEFVQMQAPGYSLRYDEVSGDQLAAVFQGYGVGSASRDDKELVDTMIGYIIGRMDLTKPLEYGNNLNNFRRILYLEDVSSDDESARKNLIEGLRLSRLKRKLREN